MHRRRDRICRAVQPGVEIRDLLGLHQPEVSIRKRERVIAIQRAQKANRRGGADEALGKHRGMVRAGHAVCQHAVQGQVRPILLETESQRAKRLRHCIAIDDQCDR